MKPHTILFDLDNTMYPASNGLMQTLDSRIIAYVCDRLGITEEEAHALRQNYLETYGTTLRGLQALHGVENEHYLSFIHDFAVDAFIDSDAELDRLLGLLPARKAIFTNAPAEHAERILQRLGIAHHFERIFDIRFQKFFPKPHPAGYQLALDELGVRGPGSVMVEDTLRNLPPARALGMNTIYINDEPPPEASELADIVAPDILAALRVL
ncbi:MAG TPA: pyrimidine 5'-nucleotidase, partial [Roseiflexaceae bacterium]|nr:pyrimidine 5'-nucleotidase [Roseiflexaceae bacterium]